MLPWDFRRVHKANIDPDPRDEEAEASSLLAPPQMKELRETLTEKCSRWLFSAQGHDVVLATPFRSDAVDELVTRWLVESGLARYLTEVYSSILEMSFVKNGPRRESRDVDGFTAEEICMAYVACVLTSYELAFFTKFVEGKGLLCALRGMFLLELSEVTAGGNEVLERALVEIRKIRTQKAAMSPVSGTAAYIRVEAVRSFFSPIEAEEQDSERLRSMVDRHAVIVYPFGSFKRRAYQAYDAFRRDDPPLSVAEDDKVIVV